MDIKVIFLIILTIIILFGIVFFLVSKNKEKETIDISTHNEITEEKVEKENTESPNIQSDKESFEIIKKEILQSNQNDLEMEEEDSQLNTNIASKTEKALLKKLELFEKNKGFIKKDVNLTSLAKQFETNTKYLSEIIKIYRQKQFNNYLNELRIRYIVDRLQKEPKYINTKISYLASDCGFTSHSTFTTIFTQIMNESPSVFMKKIKEERKSA